MTLNINRSKQMGICTPADPSCEMLRHIRTNPVTGQTDFYYPLEITDPSIRILAQECGLEIGWTRLGLRVFEAVMVPCKETAIIHGIETFIDTPSDVQRIRYLQFIRDDLPGTVQPSSLSCEEDDGETRLCPTGPRQ